MFSDIQHSWRHKALNSKVFVLNVSKYIISQLIFTIYRFNICTLDCEGFILIFHQKVEKCSLSKYSEFSKHLQIFDFFITACDLFIVHQNILNLNDQVLSYECQSENLNTS